MKSLIFGLLVFSVLSFQEDTLDDFFEKADDFFQTHVENGSVDYKDIHKNPESLHKLYRMISNVDLTNKSDAEIKAFYINAYNLLVIKQVVERYPIDNPLNVDGFFDQFKHTVAGKSLTLDELEKGTLYKKYPDPRIHFVVVCAAKGCPKIIDTAYKPETLDSQLKKKTISTLNRGYFIRVYDQRDLVEVSKIFEWYQDDFLKENKSILEFINKYRKEKIPSTYKVDYYEYDWSLNSVN